MSLSRGTFSKSGRNAQPPAAHILIFFFLGHLQVLMLNISDSEMEMNFSPWFLKIPESQGAVSGLLL